MRTRQSAASPWSPFSLASSRSSVPLLTPSNSTHRAVHMPPNGKPSGVRVRTFFGREGGVRERRWREKVLRERRWPVPSKESVCRREEGRARCSLPFLKLAFRLCSTNPSTLERKRALIDRCRARALAETLDDGMMVQRAAKPQTPFPTSNPPTRWSTTLPSKDDWPHVIISRALGCADLVLSPSKFQSSETLSIRHAGAGFATAVD